MKTLLLMFLRSVESLVSSALVKAGGLYCDSHFLCLFCLSTVSLAFTYQKGSLSLSAFRLCAAPRDVPLCGDCDSGLCQKQTYFSLNYNKRLP